MATRTWSELTCIGFIPVPREGHAAALVGDVMYVFGGRGVDGKDLGDLGSFKISNHRWYMFQNMGPQPSGRSGHAMATADGRMFVIGGESGELAPTRDDAMMVHVLDTNLIKYPESKPGQPRKPNGATSPPPQQQQPQRGLGLNLSPSGEGQPRPSPDTHQRSLSNSSPEDARRMNSSPENARRLNPSVEEAKALEDRRGAQSVDEPRRLAEGMDRRGAQSVDEPRRLNDSWRANQVPEDVRRAQEEARKAQEEAAARKAQEEAVARKAQEEARRVQEEAAARKAQEEAQRRAQEELARKAQEEAQSRRTPEGKPARPPRRSDAESADESDRARSPEQRGKSPVNMAAVAMRAQGGNSRSGSPAGRASPNGYLGHHRAGSELALGHNRSTSAMSTSGELQALRKRDAWMRAALARAAGAGFVWSDEPEGMGEWNDGVAELVLGLKQQQAKLQTTLAAQIQSASDRLAEADRVKTTALQEAAFCRAKLAAYESGLEDPGKLERDRSANLERLVAAASTERSVLERTLAERTDALALQSKLREQAEERAADAIRRAEAAEEDQARTAGEHAELLDRNLFLETSMRDHAEKIVVVQSNIAQNEAEHGAVAQKLEETIALRDEHVRALEQTQAALAATTARADDLERQWERSRQMIQSLEAEQAELRAELEARTQEAQSATQRLEHVENAWAKSREEADAHRHATTSSLGMLLDSHKDLKADEDRAVRGHVEKIHAMEMELSSLRKMLKEAGNRIGESQSDLVAHQKKASAAVADAAALRAQLDGLRTQLASNVAEHGRLKQELAMKEAAVRERASAASSAEVRLGMLRRYLVDNGLVVDEEDIDGEGRSGLVRAQQLENELRERIRLHQDTERELQDVSRRRDDAEARVSLLGQQLERAKSAASPSSPDAEGRVASAERRREETETRLNKRIQELDHDYQMAVKYVKGTEKMMRRMKEDYAKSKALNEKLQSELDASRGITSSEAGSRTRGATGRNTPLSDEGHNNIQSQLVESQRSLQRLTTDRNELRRQLEALQHDLEQSREDLVVAQNESSEREIQIEELEVKISQLEHSLSLARNGSDETVVERLTTENAALRREKDLLSHKVHILLDDQGGYGADGRPISGISRRESQTSTENGMTQFDSFEDWQQRVNSRSTNHRDSEYEPSTSYLPHERTRSGV